MAPSEPLDNSDWNYSIVTGIVMSAFVCFALGRIHTVWPPIVAIIGLVSVLYLGDFLPKYTTWYGSREPIAWAIIGYGVRWWLPFWSAFLAFGLLATVVFDLCSVGYRFLRGKK